MVQRYTLIAEVQNYIRKHRKLDKKIAVPIEKNVSAQLRQIAEKISAISSTWNPVEILTPDGENCKEQKSNFFDSFLNDKKYNPKFTYSYAKSLSVKDSRKQLLSLKENVLSLWPTTRLDMVMKDALETKINDDIATCALIEGIQQKNQHKIATAIDFKYADLDMELYSYSKMEYHKKTKPKKDIVETHKGILSDDEKKFLKTITFHAEDIKKAFEWALKQYGLLNTTCDGKGYKVIICDKATSIDVRDKSHKGPTIFIPRSRKAKADKLLSLISHEIEGHVRQSMNGAELLMIGGGPLKIDDEMLYEGLAKRYDELFRKKFYGVRTSVPHPYCTFAIQKVQKGFSFYEIFSEQLDMRLHVKLKTSPDKELPPYNEIDQKLLIKCMENSWNTTIRVIRGHTDTSNPRGFTMTKDLSYLRGWQIDKELCQLGHSHINEAAIMTSEGLSMLAEFQIDRDDLPYPYKDVTTKYWKEVIRPQMYNRPQENQSSQSYITHQPLRAN